MTGWQPIETAPRDGTEVQLHHELCPGYDTTGAYSVARGGWDLASYFISGGTMMMYAVPTHWMPLPAAPDAA